MLGEIATMLGQLGVDVVGIDILERTRQLAVDELSLEFDQTKVDLSTIATSLASIDGVGVEDARVRSLESVDHGDLLMTASQITRLPQKEFLASMLAMVSATIDATWGAVVRGQQVIAIVGQSPSPAWIASYVAGKAMALQDDEVSEEVFSITDPQTGDAVVIARLGRPLRLRERQSLRCIAEIALFVEHSLTEQATASERES
jgi:hypothetical protein